MDRLEAFSRCERLFKAEQLHDLNDEDGKRYLKLRSLNRSLYLKKILKKSGVDIDGMRVREQLPTAFCLDLTSSEIEEFIKTEYKIERTQRIKQEKRLFNELYKLTVFDWGGLHKNSLEKTIVDNYVKKISSYDLIEAAIENDLQTSLRGYVLCSWYNYWTSILIEDIFKDHDRVLPALGLIPKIDFFIDDAPYDLKVTYLPEGYISATRSVRDLRPELTLLKQSARKKDLPIDDDLPASKQLENLWLKHEENSRADPLIKELRNFRLSLIGEIEKEPMGLIKWLYENQGVRRFDASNRFFIVLLNAQNFFEGWKMKRAMPLLKTATREFLDTRKKIGRTCKFLWEGKIYTADAEVLIIKN